MLPLLKVEASVKLGAEKPGATDTSVRGLLTTRRSKASLGRKTCKAVGSVSVGAVPSRKSPGRGRWGCPQELSLGGKTCKAVGSVGAVPSRKSAGRERWG